MRIDRIELENRARIERARFMAELFADAIVAVVRLARQAWHGRNSGTLRPMIK